MGCWCGCLSRARCRVFAYGPADATAIPKPHRLLPHLDPDWFYLSGTGLSRLPWKKRPLNGCAVVEVVVILATSVQRPDHRECRCATLLRPDHRECRWATLLRLDHRECRRTIKSADVLPCYAQTRECRCATLLRLDHRECGFATLQRPDHRECGCCQAAWISVEF